MTIFLRKLHLQVEVVKNKKEERRGTNQIDVAEEK